MIRFILNDKEITTDLPPGTVLLDYIRYHRQLPGTKIGCREGDCGACTVLVGTIQNGLLHYDSMTSCLMPLGNAQGKHIVTVEGLNFPGRLNPIQDAMAEEGATQCGFCTPGFVMSLAGYCLQNGEPGNVIAAVDGNICRCTGYKSIERAAEKIAGLLKERKGEAADFAAKNKILPEYFTGIKERLQHLEASPLPATGSVVPTILGGGTDLYVQRHDELTHAGIRFVADDPKLKGIRKEGNTCWLGASVTVADLQRSELIHDSFPQFPLYAKLVSSTPIRNMATIAGNFVNASPIGDFTIFFLALNATIVLNDGGTKRQLPLRQFYKGYKSLDKKPDELIEALGFECPGPHTLFHFEKVSKRTHLDIASVNSAICLDMDGIHIKNAGLSAGGVGPVPMFLQKTSEFLKGKAVSVPLVMEAIGVMETEITPISDARGAKEYKKLLLGQLMKAHFKTLFPELDIKKLLAVEPFRAG